MNIQIQQERMRGYLLGRLSEVDADQLEEEYFFDPEALLALKREEQLLISEYLDNRLLPADRDLFQAKYLKVPELIRCVEEAGRQRQSIPLNSRGGRSRIWIGFTLAASLALILLALSWNLKVQELPPLAFQLSPGVAKSGASATIHLPAKPLDVTFNLELAGPVENLASSASIFEVALDGSRKSIVTKLPKAKRRVSDKSGSFSIVVNSSVLRPGDFVIELLDEQSSLLDSYVFRCVSEAR